MHFEVFSDGHIVSRLLRQDPFNIGFKIDDILGITIPIGVCYILKKALNESEEGDCRERYLFVQIWTQIFSSIVLFILALILIPILMSVIQYITKHQS